MPLQMTWLTIKKLLTGADTRLFPKTAREPFPGTRGSLVFDEASCNFCTLCEKKCPSQAIKVDRKERVWTLDRFRCIVCGDCVDACAKHSLTLSTHMAMPVTSHAAGTERHHVPLPTPAPTT